MCSLADGKVIAVHPPPVVGRRLKRVSAEQLEDIFCRNGSGRQGHGRHPSRAVQTDVLSRDISRNEQLLSLPSLGVITPNHARDRGMLLRLSGRLATEILLAEQWHRAQMVDAWAIAVDSLRHAFVKTIPLPPSFYLRRLQPHPPGPLQASPPPHDPVPQAVQSVECEEAKLRAHIKFLERKLQVALKLLTRAVPSRSSWSAAAATTLSDALRSCVSAAELTGRSMLEELEHTEFNLLLSRGESLALSLRVAAWVQTLSPSASMSSGGCDELLQIHQIKARSAIEAEEGLAVEALSVMLLHPWLAKENAALRSQVVHLKEEIHRREFSAAQRAFKKDLSAVVEAEESSRCALGSFEEEEGAFLHALPHRPSEIDALHHTVRKLQSDLHQQQCRFRRETEALRMLLPYDGVRPACSPFAPHCEVTAVSFITGS